MRIKPQFIDQRGVGESSGAEPFDRLLADARLVHGGLRTQSAELQEELYNSAEWIALEALRREIPMTAVSGRWRKKFEGWYVNAEIQDHPGVPGQNFGEHSARYVGTILRADGSLYEVTKEQKGRPDNAARTFASKVRALNGRLQHSYEVTARRPAELRMFQSHLLQFVMHHQLADRRHVYYA